MPEDAPRSLSNVMLSRLTLNEDQAAIHRLAMPEMRDQPQRSKELSSVHRVPRGKARTEQFEDSVDLGGGKRGVATTDPSSCLACADGQRGVVRVIMRHCCSLLVVFAGEVEQGLGVERVLRVCERRRVQSQRAHVRVGYVRCSLRRSSCSRAGMSSLSSSRMYVVKRKEQGNGEKASRRCKR